MLSSVCFAASKNFLAETLSWPPMPRINLKAANTWCLDRRTSTISSLAVESRWKEEEETCRSTTGKDICITGSCDSLALLPSAYPGTAGGREDRNFPGTAADKPERQFQGGLSWEGDTKILNHNKRHNKKPTRGLESLSTWYCRNWCSM